MREVNYDYIYYPLLNSYGYWVKSSQGTLDFFDKDLNVVIPDFEYDKYHLSLALGKFNYFIVNNYVCIIKHVVDDYGRSQFRCIIESKDGEAILDSMKHRCFPLGDFIQINSEGKSKFFNTMNREIGDLNLVLPVNELGKIDFYKDVDFKDTLKIEDGSRLSLPPKNDKLFKR